MLRQLVQASFPPSSTWNDKWSTSTVVPNNFPPLTDQTCTTDTISCRSSQCCSLLTRQHNSMVYQCLVWRMLCRSSRPQLHSEDVKPRVHCRCCRLLSSAAAMIMLETRWRKWFIALVTSDCWVFSGKTQLTAITELLSWLQICLSRELNTFFFSGIVCVVVIVEFLSDIVFFIVWLVHNKWLRRWVSCNVTTILRARDGGDGPGPYQQLPADTSLESSLSRKLWCHASAGAAWPCVQCTMFVQPVYNTRPWNREAQSTIFGLCLEHFVQFVTFDTEAQ